MKKRYILLFILIVIALAFWLFFRTVSAPIGTAPGGDDSAGSAVLPAQKYDMIVVDTPLQGSVISSPLVIKGKARGNWYFEASFPIELRDANGTMIAQHYAEAQSDWMTTEYVPFIATLTFPTSGAPTHKGTLILRNDNPSGEPQFDKSIEIPILY